VFFSEGKTSEPTRRAEHLSDSGNPPEEIKPSVATPRPETNVQLSEHGGVLRAACLKFNFLLNRNPLKPAGLPLKPISFQPCY